MSEPNNSAPNDIVEGDAGAPSSEPMAPESVELDVDQEKLEAWNEVKSDYQIEPNGDPVPNSMAPSQDQPVEEDNEQPGGTG